VTTFESIVRDPNNAFNHRPWHQRAREAVARLASKSRRTALVTGAKALVVTIQGRFTLTQMAGGTAASTGVFMQWGAAVGLMVTGVAVLAAATVLERQVS
jgi:hypothetical protein